MKFNFDLFKGIATTVYQSDMVNTSYSLDDCLGVFKLYFETFERYRGKPHSGLHREQIARIMNAMPTTPYPIDDGTDEPFDLEPSDYAPLIAKHFQTRYGQKCDYGINHFFSGEVRGYRVLDGLVRGGGNYV